MTAGSAVWCIFRQKKKLKLSLVRKLAYILIWTSLRHFGPDFRFWAVRQKSSCAGGEAFFLAGYLSESRAGLTHSEKHGLLRRFAGVKHH